MRGHVLLQSLRSADILMILQRLTMNVSGIHVKVKIKKLLSYNKNNYRIRYVTMGQAAASVVRANHL